MWAAILGTGSSSGNKGTASEITSKLFQSWISYKYILYVLMCEIGHGRVHLFSSREGLNDAVWREELQLKDEILLWSILQNKKARPRFRIFGVRGMQIMPHSSDFNAVAWIWVPHKTHEYSLFQTAFVPVNTTWDAGSEWKSSRAISRISTCYSLPIILVFWAKCFKIFLIFHLETINMQFFIGASKKPKFSWLPVCTQSNWSKQEYILVCICSSSVFSCFKLEA